MTPIEQLYASFLEVYILLDDNERHFFGRYGLSSARYHALLHISEAPGLSLRELSDFLLCTKGNTTRIVKSMEAHGLLTRQVDQDDSRALCLYLTEKGHALLEEVRLAYREFKAACFGNLTPSEQEVLSRIFAQQKRHLRARLRA
ncbi:MAG: MarR family winged helix-turn-helix transcriptional regulator [Chloroflexota bacterium]